MQNAFGKYKQGQPTAKVLSTKQQKQAQNMFCIKQQRLECALQNKKL